ncbi:MAG: hypothetical protein ACW990_18155 [Promethearchaeota archaeon]|jgi:IS30 family transposase
MALTLKQKEKYVDLRSDGLSFNTIAVKMHVSKNTLISLQLELETEVRNATYLKYQAIIEKYKLNSKNKIESHSKQLAKVIDEIDKRDMSELTLKELLALKESLENGLQKELSVSYITDKQRPMPDFDSIMGGKETIPL